MPDESDILTDISDDDLPELLEMYEKHKDWAPHVYSTIATGIEWKRGINGKYMKFMSPNGCWRQDGTFFVLLERYSFDIFVFSLDDTGANIYEAITKTRRLDPVNYNDKEPYIYALHDKFYSVVAKAFKQKGKVFIDEIPTYLYTISRDEALKFNPECPPEVCIKKLDASHAAIASSLWPHKYKNAEKFVAFLIEMNSGYGVFLKSTNELVSWMLVSMMGQLTILQTLEGYKKKGYGSLITKYVSREIAGKGHNVLATVKTDNYNGMSMFAKIGFKNSGKAYFPTVTKRL